jgi:hypothetical protein
MKVIRYFASSDTGGREKLIRPAIRRSYQYEFGKLLLAYIAKEAKITPGKACYNFKTNSG